MYGIASKHERSKRVLQTNKEQIRNRIHLMPIFELRRVKVKGDLEGDDQNWSEAITSRAVCKVGENIPYAFVGSKYDLVQFKDVFLPIIDSMNVPMEGYVMDYGGFASLVLFPEIEGMSEGDTKFGIVASNSVDCSSAVIVKFCIEHGTNYITIPSKVAGLKRKHTGKIAGIVKDYATLVGSVRQLWTNIINEFPKYSVVKELDATQENQIEFKAVIKSFQLGDRLSKALEEKMQKKFLLGSKYTLWDAFIDAIGSITERKYKSEVHKQRRIDKLSEKVFQYAATLAI